MDTLKTAKPVDVVHRILQVTVDAETLERLLSEWLDTFDTEDIKHYRDSDIGNLWCRRCNSPEWFGFTKQFLRRYLLGRELRAEDGVHPSHKHVPCPKGCGVMSTDAVTKIVSASIRRGLQAADVISRTGYDYTMKSRTEDCAHDNEYTRGSEQASNHPEDDNTPSEDAGVDGVSEEAGRKCCPSETPVD